MTFRLTSKIARTLGIVFSFWMILILACSHLALAEPLSQNEIDDLLSCYKKEFQNKTTGIEKYKLAFSRFPEESFHKLFIDKARLENPSDAEKLVAPAMIFDVREPGYHESMMDAFSALPKYLGKRLTLDSVVELHDLAVEKVQGGRDMHKGFGTHHYTTSYANIDPKAYLELMKSGVLFDPISLVRDLSKVPLACGYLSEYRSYAQNQITQEKKSYLSVAEPTCGGVVSISSSGTIKDLDPLFDHYYSSIDGVSSLSGKLSAIAELLRALEVAHVLADGNQRTYAFLVLNLLLIENGVPPAILDDPTMFDGFMTVEDMSRQIRKGISSFLNESPEAQRRFLVENCSEQQNSSHSPYIAASSNDYTPFHSKGQISTEETYLNLKREIESAIQTGEVNTKTVKGNCLDSPLDRAIYIGSVELVEQLLEKGADPFGKVFSKRWCFFPYKHARRYGSLKIAQLFLDRANQAAIDQEFIKLAIWIEANINGDSVSLAEYKNHSRELIGLMDTLLGLATEETLKDSSVAEDLSAWSKIMIDEAGPAFKDLIEQLVVKYKR